MFEFITDAFAVDKVPVKSQTPPAIIRPASCDAKDIDKIRECLEKKFKDDTPDPHEDMWDPDWIKKK